jgi:hypothetical protein
VARVAAPGLRRGVPRFRVNKHRSPLKQGETDMGDKGKKDKGKREHQKKAMLSPKEKRKQKKEKKRYE